MNQAVIADIGPLYAAVDPDDQYHRRAQRELKRITQEKRELVIAYPILLEGYTLVLYRLGGEAAISWLTEIVAGTAFVNPTVEDYREAVRRVSRFADQKITVFDATVAVLAARLSLKVWTYDHHFDVMRAPIWR